MSGMGNRFAAGFISLVMGAQRFAASAGLQAEVSVAYKSALSSVKWATVDVSTAHPGCDPADTWAPTPPPWTTWPLAPPPPPSPLPCHSLLWMLVALAIALVTATALQSIAFILWKRKMNRKWYQHRPTLTNACSSDTSGLTDGSWFEHGLWFEPRCPGEEATLGSTGVDISQRERNPRFIPYPPAFVFPGLQLLLVSFLGTGIAGEAALILSSAGTTRCLSSFCTCSLLAYIALVIMAIYIVIAIALLANFNHNHRTDTWHRALPVASTWMVEDPLFRAVSKVRAYLCWHDPVLERSRGKFVRPPSETMEPDRTHRLLGQPIALRRAMASDALDAYGFALMARARGSSSSSTSFEVTTLIAQMVVAMLNGLGSGLGSELTSTGAVGQMLAVMGVQAAASLWILCMSPTWDRCVSMVVGLQFALEATQTALLLLCTLLHEPTLEIASLAVALSALFLPIGHLAYDAFVVQLFRATQGGLTRFSACSACLNLVCYVPRAVLQMMGIQVDYSADAIAEHAGDDLQKFGERSHEDSVAAGVNQSRSSKAPVLVRHGEHVPHPTNDSAFEKSTSGETSSTGSRLGSPRCRFAGETSTSGEEGDAGSRLGSPRSRSFHTDRDPAGRGRRERPGFRWLERIVEKVERGERRSAITWLTKSESQSQYI